MNDKKIISLSKKLISIPSVTDDLKPCNEVLGVATKELGGFKYRSYTSKKAKSLLFYNTKTLPKKFKIILNAHLDVVPARKQQFKPLIKGNKLFGRGAYDMKAAGAVMILVFKQLAEELDYPLGLQLVSDEETGGYNGTRNQVKNGVKTEFVLIGEPTELQIGYKNRATYWIRLKTEGISGHGAYPWNAKNALDMLLSDINKIKSKFINPDKQSWKSSVSITDIKTNNGTINKIPSYAEALLDIRPIPKEYEKVKDYIKRNISKETKIEVLSDATFHNIESDNTYFIKLKDSIKEVTKRKAVLLEKYGGNDLVHHYENGSTRGVLFGPSGGGMHSKDEWVDIKSLSKYSEVLQNFLLSVN